MIYKENGSGVKTIKYHLPDYISIASGQYHFKFYALCSAYTGAYAEGDIGIEDINILISVAWANQKITSITVDSNNDLVIVCNDYMYAMDLSFTNGETWCATP